MSSDAAKYLRLARSVVPTIAFSIVWIAQSGGRFPPMIVFFIVGAVVLSVGTAVTRSGVIRRSSRSGRTGVICEDVAARGRSVADDLLADRSSNL